MEALKSTKNMYFPMKWNKVLVSRPYEGTSSWVMVCLHVRAALLKLKNIINTMYKAKVNIEYNIKVKNHIRTFRSLPATRKAAHGYPDGSWVLGLLICAELTWPAGYWSLLHVLMTSPIKGTTDNHPALSSPITDTVALCSMFKRCRGNQGTNGIDGFQPTTSRPS